MDYSAEQSRIPPSTVPWDIATVLMALFFGYLLLPWLGVNLIAILLPLLDGPPRYVLEQSTQVLGWGLVFVYLNRRFPGALRPAMGLALERPVKWYILQGLQAIFPVLAVMLLVNLLAALLGLVPADPYEMLPREEFRTLTFFAVATAPILEELVFRGLVQTTLKKLYPPMPAILLTCTLFALMHPAYFASPMALLYVFSLGVVFGLIRERTGSTLPGMLAHFVNNGLASLQALMQ